MQKRKFVAEDLYRFKFVSDPQLSPDGKNILYVKTTTEEEKYLPNIWKYSVEDGCDSQFTFGNGDERPRWSPDGTQIAFLSKRTGKKQLYVMSTTGGEAGVLVAFRYGVKELVWSPDGTKIAFTAASFEGQTVADLLKLEEDEVDKADKKQASIARKITRLNFKMNGLPGAGLKGNKCTHIYVVDVASGEVTQITQGRYNESTPAWAPCGKGLVFSSNRAEDPDYSPRVADLWYVSLESKELVKLTDSDGRYSFPAFSANGRYLAYYGSHNEYDSATNQRLFVKDMQSGEVREVTKAYDRSMGMSHSVDMKLGAPIVGPVWSACQKYVYVTSSSEGMTHIYKVTLDTGKVEQVTQGALQVNGYSFNAKLQQAAIAYADATQPGDIALVNLTDGSQKRCTEVNKEILDACYVALPEEFWYKGVDNWDVQGWILKPYGFKEGVKYPYILEVHGGPHAMYSTSFFFEFQLLTAAGYVVMFVNPRGSQGYGQKFCNAVRGDYGGNDYGDLMKAVDYAETLPYVDASRMGITGGSYGGFMTNWVVGQTNRFKAAVTQRSISNWVSFFGVSDIGNFFGASEVGCTPWGNVEKMWHHSPLKYVERVHTPLLMIHGEEDIRCPMEQAEQFYVFLKFLKRKVELLRFPHENHELSRSGQPNRRVARLKAIVGWFNDHIERHSGDYLN